ncbi:MAG: heparinase II/III family protein [Candidatus Omnitrophica bacterium]|nr:heparinase II/III family protein [Candidatus Omnitrophota bacterium]
MMSSKIYFYIVIFCLFPLFVQGEIVFQDRPRFLHTKSEIESLNNPAELQRAMRQADAILDKPLKIPEKEGDWIFYYYCPKDNAMLKAETETRHICPACGTAYTDERTIGAYRTHLNYKIDKDCITLAKAYAFTGDERYAERVKQILLKLAALYPTFERHDRWGRKGVLAVVGGRRYAQNLDEAVSAIDLASAYDLVADATCFSDEDRKNIEKFLQNIVREILKFQIFHGGKNNHQTWFNAAYTVVGLITGDESLIREGIYGRYGLLWQVENSITRDGLWYEGTIAYHFYALQAIQYTLDAAKSSGIDFSKNERLKSMWLGPINLAYPDGSMPVFHDSDPVNLKITNLFFLWAYRYFGDKIFERYAGIKSDLQDTGLKSINLSDTGIAVLRKGEGNKQVCVMLDYGPHGDSHGHPDKLNIVVFANGKEFLLDPGRISYSVPEYNTWCRTTVAHNTVVIDEKNQQPSTGKLLYFVDSVDYSACLSICDSAYPGYVLKRFLLLTENFLVDVFSVEGQKKADIDWIIHFRGELKETQDFVPVDFQGVRDGYKHLKNVKKVDAIREPLSIEISQHTNDRIRIFLLKNQNSEIFTGTGIGYHLKDSVPFLMQRKNSSVATFIAVYDFSSRIKHVQNIPVYDKKNKKMTENEAIGMKILLPEKSFEIGIDLRDKVSDVFLGSKKFQRLLFRET